MNRLLRSAAVIGIICFLVAPVVTGQELTVDDYIKFWTPTVGTWKGTFEHDGKVDSIVFRVRVAPNKKCLLLYDETNGMPGTQHLQTYDPVSKKEIDWCVDKEGNRQIQTITIDGMEKGKVAAKGAGGSWEVKLFNNDGTTGTITCKWVFTELDDKHSVMVWSEVKEDGVSKPDMRMKLERQPERERRSRQ